MTDVLPLPMSALKLRGHLPGRPTWAESCRHSCGIPNFRFGSAAAGHPMAPNDRLPPRNGGSATSLRWMLLRLSFASESTRPQPLRKA